MKKIILTVIVLASFLSCEYAGKAKVDTTDSTSSTEMMENVPMAIVVPKFRSADVQKIANEYGEFIKTYVAALQAHDTIQEMELGMQAQEWAEKISMVGSDMTAEDAKAWREYTTALAEDISKAMTHSH